MGDFDNIDARAAAAFAAAQGHETVGLSFTITGDGQKSLSLTLGGHSVPVYNDDTHAKTAAALVGALREQFGDGFNKPRS